MISVLTLAALLLTPVPRLLDSPRFKTREVAHRVLSQAREVALPALLQAERWAKKRGCAEVQRRVSQLLADYRHGLAKAECRRLFPGRLPWITCLAENLPLHESRWLEEARNRTPVSERWQTDYKEYRLATRLWLTNCLQRGTDLGTLRKLVERMWRDEENWCRSHDKVFKGPKPER